MKQRLAFNTKFWMLWEFACSLGWWSIYQPCCSKSTFIRSSCTKNREPTNTSTNY